MIDRDLLNVKVDILKKFDIFSDLHESELIELAKISKLCNLKKGTLIYREGDPSKYLYIISQGKTKSFCNAMSGRIIGETISENIIGVHNLLTGEPRWACAVAVDNVIMLRVRNKDFISYLQNKPMLIFKFWNRTNYKLNIVSNRLRAFIDCSAEQKVIDVLYGLHEKSNSFLPLHFKLEDIASICGLTRETTARITGHLKRDGIIESNYHGIRIKDISKLENLKRYYPIM
jgi:CRP/FNR family transcriptional regulator